jgi:hypothetical protein
VVNAYGAVPLAKYGFQWIIYEKLEHSYVYRSETNVLGILHRVARIGTSHGRLHGPVGRELVIVISFVQQSEAEGLDNGNRTKVSRPTLSKRRLLSKPYKVVCLTCFSLQVAALGACRLDQRWYNGTRRRRTGRRKFKGYRIFICVSCGLRPNLTKQSAPSCSSCDGFDAPHCRFLPVDRRLRACIREDRLNCKRILA